MHLWESSDESWRERRRPARAARLLRRRVVHRRDGELPHRWSTRSTSCTPSSSDERRAPSRLAGRRQRHGLRDARVRGARPGRQSRHVLRAGCRRDPPRPHLLRQHGAGLPPARVRGRGGGRRPHRAEPAAARRRARRRADLVDRVRAPRRHPAPAAAALRLVRGRGRLDPARHADAARPRPLGRRHAGERHLRRAHARCCCPRRRSARSRTTPTRSS